MCVKISQLINAELDMRDPVVASIQQALLLWSHIEAFLKRIYIKPDKHEQYEHEIESFKKNVIRFITCGAKTFLTKHKTGDDNETFYVHALLCYLPNFVDNAWEKHRLRSFYHAGTIEL